MKRDYIDFAYFNTYVQKYTIETFNCGYLTPLANGLVTMSVCKADRCNFAGWKKL